MAGRLKVLQFTQRVYQNMGIYPTKPNRNRKSINWRNLSILVSITQELIFALSFLIFEAKSIPEVGISFFTVTTVFANLIYFLINMFSNMPKLRRLIGNFEEFIDKRIRCSATSIEYSELIENIEKMSNIVHFVTVKLTFIGIGASSLLITAINYYIYDLKEKSFYLPFPVLLPFDWKTPFGYVIAVIGFFTAMYAVLIENSPILSFAVASCWLIVTFVRDITNDLSHFSAQELREINHREVKNRLCHILQQLSDTKQFVNDFNSINEIILTGLFLWSLLNIGSTLLVLQAILSQPNPDPIEMTTPSIMVIWSFFLIFFYCESGHFVMNQFDEFDQKLYQCVWYLFPIEMQKMLVIVMLNMQKPVIIRGLANAYCSREVFKKTAKGGFSYFMTMRQV